MKLQTGVSFSSSQSIKYNALSLPTQPISAYQLEVTMQIDACLGLNKLGVDVPFVGSVYSGEQSEFVASS